MKKTKIKIPIYDFNLTVIEDVEVGESEKFKKVLEENELSEEHINEELEALSNGCKNGGNTYRNLGKKKFLVVISPCSTKGKRRNVLTHEFRHVVDRMFEYININDFEASAYLQGWLAEQYE